LQHKGEEFLQLKTEKNIMNRPENKQIITDIIRFQEKMQHKPTKTTNPLYAEIQTVMNRVNNPQSNYAYLGDIILIEADFITSAPNQRAEALVLRYVEDSVKIRYKRGSMIEEIWIGTDSICASLGKPTSNQIVELNITDNEMTQNVINVETGVYIVHLPELGTHVIEIEKYNEQYLYHFIDDSAVFLFNKEQSRELHVFSEPDHPNANYLLEPGAYLSPTNQMVEVVPYEGSCWVRQIGGSEIIPLTDLLASQLRRLETDNLDPEFYIAFTGEKEPENVESPQTPPAITPPTPETSSDEDITAFANANS